MNAGIYRVRALVLIATLLSAPAAFAGGVASWFPSNAAGDDGTAESVMDGDIIDINPNRDVIATDAGFDGVSSIRVDTTTGVIQGFASYALDAPQTYPDVDAAGSAGAGGGLTLDTFLAGPGGPGTVDVTVEFAFDGAFIVDAGSPTLVLAGNLSLTTFNPASPLTGTIYGATLSFNAPAIATPGADVDTIFSGTQSPLGGAITDFDGASAEIISDTPDDLDAVLRLTAPVTVGDTFLLTAFILGGAGPSPDPADTNTDDGIDVLAAAGATDFSNSASLRILLPPGYALSGDDPLIANVVTTVPLPLPAALLALPLATMLGRRRSAAC